MIDVQIIKQKILEIAFQGGLVINDYNDESVSCLYEEILKSNDLKDIAAVHLYDIPTNWKWISLGHVGIWGAGATPSRNVKEYYGGSIPWLKTGDLNDGVIESVPEYITGIALKETSVKLNSIGAVLIAMYGATIGKLGILGIESTTNQACCACNVYKGIYNKYLFYYLMSQRDNLKNMGSGGAQSNISKEKITGYSFPLAPYKEQVCIVEKIDEIFKVLDTIEELQTKYASNLEVLKAKIIDAGIQGKLTEQLPEDGTADELLKQIEEEKKQLIKGKKIKSTKAMPEITEAEITFEIPSNWKWVRWGALSQSIQYGYNAPAKSEGRIKMVRISDIQDGNVLWDTVPYCDIEENEIESYLLHENDILFARTGGTVGKSYIVTEIPEECVFAGYLIRTSYSTKLCARYMKYFMESKLYWRQLQNGTIATAQPNCNGQTLSKMILPLPPYAEQVRIVEKINDAMAAVENM